METTIAIHSQNILLELAIHQSLYAYLNWQKFVKRIVMTIGLYNGKFGKPVKDVTLFLTPHLYNASIKTKRSMFHLHTKISLLLCGRCD